MRHRPRIQRLLHIGSKTVRICTQFFRLCTLLFKRRTELLILLPHSIFLFQICCVSCVFFHLLYCSTFCSGTAGNVSVLIVSSSVSAVSEDTASTGRRTTDTFTTSSIGAADAHTVHSAAASLNGLRSVRTYLTHWCRSTRTAIPLRRIFQTQRKKFQRRIFTGQTGLLRRSPKKQTVKLQQCPKRNRRRC